MSKQYFQLSVAAAAVAAVFAMPAHAAISVAGAGASAINNAATTAVATDYCGGVFTAYDSNGTAPTTFPKGSIWAISCTPVAAAGLTSNPFVVSYDSTGGSWKAFLATTPALVTAAQADFTARGGQNAAFYIDPATTTCAGTVAITQKFANGNSYTFNSNYGCTTTQATPTFGFTDVEPKMFTGSTANQPFEWNTWNTGGVPLVASFVPGAEATGYPKQAFGVVFGVAASQALWAAMFNDQVTAGILPSATCGTAFVAGATSNTLEICTPIISREMYSSLITQTGGAALNDAQTLFVGTPPAAATAASGTPALEVARRDQGSGTQASSNEYFVGQGCDVAATESPDSVITPDLSLVEDAAGGLYANSFTYNLSTGDVINRLQLTNPTSDGFVNFALPANGYVIGVVSGEKYSAASINATGAAGSSTAPWGFLRLEGVLPTNQRVSQGLYNYTTTEFFHCSASAAGDAAKFCSDLTTVTFADSLANYAKTGVTGIYPIQSVPASLGNYFGNGRICAGNRHH